MRLLIAPFTGISTGTIITQNARGDTMKTKDQKRNKERETLEK
jgi:hypothetical protein